MVAYKRHEQKRHGKHQKHTRHYLKVYTPYLPLLLIVVTGLVLSVLSPPKLSKGVLAYATSMSTGELLQATNQARAANGKPTLKLNTTLNSAAQAKANDMVAKDYWAHDPPGCPTPGTCWYQFVVSSGYKYTALGENLAYGYGTASATVQGWMNSPEHKTNMLNSNYTEVGFGYKNSSNFVKSGQETVVVAEYAKPAASKTVAPTSAAPAATKSASTTTSAPSQPKVTQPTPAASPTKSQAPPVATVAKIKDTVVEPSVQTSRLSQVTGFNPGWLAAVTSLITVIGLSALALRHAYAIRKWLKSGERYVLGHFAFDLTIISLIGLCYIANQTVGFIK